MLSVSERAALASEMSQYRQDIAVATTDQMFKIQFWRLRFGERGQAACLRDNLRNIDLFISAVRHSSLMMVEQHVTWLRGILINLGMCTSYLIQNFTHMQQITAQYASPSATKAFNHVFNRALSTLAYTDPLSQELVKQQDLLIKKVVNKTYSSTPYWEARYGKHGRSSCAMDLYYSLAYLADALALNTMKGALLHTKWMRDFLISRGMCSEHYLTPLVILVDELCRLLPETYHHQLREWLREVSEHLRYQHPLEQHLLAHRSAIIAQCLTEHYEQSPSLQSRWQHSEYESDVYYRLSYLTDALCQDNPELFTDYLQWQAENLARLKVTSQEYQRGITIFADALPTTHLPPEVQTWLQPPIEASSSPQISQWAAKQRLLLQEVWEALHGVDSFWDVLLVEARQPQWKRTLEAAIALIGQAIEEGNLQPTLDWLNKQAERWGASAAYLIDFTQALAEATDKHLAAETATQLKQATKQALEGLAEQNTSLAIQLVPELISWSSQQMASISPYWQVNYQRRSAKLLEHDIRLIISVLAKAFEHPDETYFSEQIGKQHHYLLSQGICTAYYQYLLDIIGQALPSILDDQSTQRATTMLNRASTQLDSSHPQILAMLQSQDMIVNTAFQALQQQAPELSRSYPNGWSDAKVDLYYWLAYLSDTLTFKQPTLFTNHRLWLNAYMQQRGGDQQSTALIISALSQAIEGHLPPPSKELLDMMQFSGEQ